jgi:hypothetical protein
MDGVVSAFLDSRYRLYEASAVLLADDHPAVLALKAAALEDECLVIGKVGDGQELVAEAELAVARGRSQAASRIEHGNTVAFAATLVNLQKFLHKIARHTKKSQQITSQQHVRGCAPSMAEVGKEINMSEEIDQFCDNLKTRLNTIEKPLLDARAALEAAPQQAKHGLESRVAEVRASLEERRQEVEAVRQRATGDL